MIDFHFFSKNWLIWHPQQKTLGLFPWCWPAISIRRLRKNHQIISKIYSVPRYPFTKRWKAPTPDFKGFYQNRLFQNTSLNHSLWEPVETPPGFFSSQKTAFRPTSTTPGGGWVPWYWTFPISLPKRPVDSMSFCFSEKAYVFYHTKNVEKITSGGGHLDFGPEGDETH